MKKLKFIWLFTCLCLFLNGCSVKDSNYGLSRKDPIEITLWHYYNGAQATSFEILVSEFNRTTGTEKGIIVNSVSQGSIADLITALRNSANKVVGASNMPNIFQSYLDTALELDEMNIIASLDPYVSEDTKKKYVDAFIEEGCFDSAGSLKLFPVAKGTELLMLNKTDWDKFSTETGATTEALQTLEGLTETAAAYYEWSGGNSFFGRDAMANYILTGSKQLGHELFQVDGKTVTLDIDRETMKKLWDNYYIPYIKGHFKHIGRYRSDDLKIGELISLVCSSSGATYFPSEVTIEDSAPYPIETLILPVPGFAGTEKYAVQQGASMAVTKSDERSEYASVVFLEWITAPSHNLGFTAASGYLPVTKEALNTETITAYVNEYEKDLPVNKLNSLMISTETFNEYKLYTTKGFKNGYEARNFLESSMIDLAQSDRAAILANAAASTEEALEPYITEAYFNQWFEQFSNQLTNICNQ